MPETLLERHYRDRLHSVRHLALHESGRAPLSWGEIEDLVVLCADLASAGTALLEQEYKRIFKEPKPTVAWLRERRLAIVDLSDRYRELVESIRDAAYCSSQAAESPARKNFAGELQNALQALTQAREAALARWPVGSDDEITGSPGEGLEMDAAFAQIAGVNEETWRRRLEEDRRHGRA